MAGVIKAGGKGVGAGWKGESMAEVNLGRDRKKMSSNEFWLRLQCMI